jgi:hypothetical protein
MGWGREKERGERSEEDPETRQRVSWERKGEG